MRCLTEIEKKTKKTTKYMQTSPTKALVIIMTQNAFLVGHQRDSEKKKQWAATEQP